MINLNRAKRIVELKIETSHEEVEFWKEQHEEALLVFDCEHQLERMVEIFDNLEHLDALYLELLTNSKVEYDQMFDEGLKDLMNQWVNLAMSIQSFQLSWALKNGYDLKGRKEFEDRLARGLESKDHDYDLAAQKLIQAVLNNMPTEKVSKLSTPISAWPE